MLGRERSSTLYCIHWYRTSHPRAAHITSHSVKHSPSPPTIRYTRERRTERALSLTAPSPLCPRRCSNVFPNRSRSFDRRRLTSPVGTIGYTTPQHGNSPRIFASSLVRRLHADEELNSRPHHSHSRSKNSSPVREHGSTRVRMLPTYLNGKLPEYVTRQASA